MAWADGLRKEHSESAWPIFMPKIFESIFDADADARRESSDIVSENLKPKGAET